MGLVFVLSAQSGLRVSEDPEVDRPLRMLAHAVTYAILAGLILFALSGAGRVTLAGVVAAFVIAVLYGVSDEFHQSFVPDRTGQVSDVAIDAFGAAVGVVLAAIILRRGLPAGSSARRQ